jgi:catechol 2,3-dioxygenase-like lactoylglutathione lyase family enzyme
VSQDLEIVRPDENAAGPGFALRAMFHASLRTPDIGQVERWFARVFARPSVPFDELLGPSPDPLNPDGHSTATVIEDLLVASTDPRCYLRDGVQCYPLADRPRLSGFGWYVDGVEQLYGLVRDLGYPIVDERGAFVDRDEPPAVGGGEVPMFWLDPEVAGLRYQFLPAVPFPTDPRVAPGWEPPRLADDDPLGIIRCSHHTVLTAEPKRAVRLFADLLGGTVIHEGRDEVRGLESVYLWIADAVYEFAVPDKGTPAHADWPPGIPRDTYHAITFQVRDLDQVAQHLAGQGVRLQSRTEHCIVTEPRTSLGVPWGFVTALLPGDLRGGER